MIKFIQEKLIKIGCKIKKIKNMMNVTPPSWRPDIKIKEDLLKKLVDLYGFENIPSKPFDLKNNLKEMSYSFSQKIKKDKKIISK